MFPDPAYVAKQAERERLIKALVGGEDEPVPLASWLHSGISDLRKRGPDREECDPDAYGMMIAEMESLYGLLEQLTNLEQGKTDLAALVEERTRRLAVDDNIPL